MSATATLPPPISLLLREQQLAQLRQRLVASWIAVALLQLYVNEWNSLHAWAVAGYFLTGLTLTATVITHLSQWMRQVASALVPFTDVVDGNQSLMVVRTVNAVLLVVELGALCALSQLLLLAAC